MKRLIMVMASLVGALTHADVRGADPETFSDWVKMLKGGDGGTSNWVVDKLDGFAEGYKSRIAANPNDYEARLLHAATLVASLGENETMRSYLTTFGFEIDYLGLKLSGEQSAPATWPDTNEIVDAAVAQCAPILQEALDDLKAIPDGWTGEVHLDSATWPLDEDVYIDIADVLYARAGLESVLGVLYFLKGYDLTVDWPKARNLDKPQIPVLAHAPDMVNDDGWDGVLTWGSRDYYDLSAGPAIQMAFADNRLYIRLNSDDGFEDDDFCTVSLLPGLSTLARLKSGILAGTVVLP